MLKRQPGRPTELGFIGAAVRFIGDEYEPQEVPVSNGKKTRTITIFPGKHLDVQTIEAERMWDGKTGEPETLTEFAIRQLAAYQRMKRN